MGEQPPAKKQKISSKPEGSFPIVPKEQHASLKQFVAMKIKSYLGEEEATLIDFIMQHVTECKTAELLVPELEVVLEEDSLLFLQELWDKVQELQ